MKMNAQPRQKQKERYVWSNCEQMSYHFSSYENFSLSGFFNRELFNLFKVDIELYVSEKIVSNNGANGLVLTG